MGERLLQRIAEGDSSAIAEVLDRYGGLVWALARRAGAGQSDAEDAVQEIFTDVWRSASRFDPSVASEATFIAMIARRRLIDRRRRAARRATERATVDITSLAHDEPAPMLDSHDEAAIAVKALQSLRPEQQNVIRMSVIQGMSHERIAESTGLPLGTVKTHVRRGLIRIRELLDQSKASGLGVAL
ncbi:MAG: RNA polymerase sigma factor [Phycisphaerales bacterium]